MKDPVLMIVFAWFIIMSIIDFILYGVDKKKAKNGQWRISERTLLLTAAIGGSFGAFLGMQHFRHKTNHKQFVIGVPVMLVLHVVLIAVLLWVRLSA